MFSVASSIALIGGRLSLSEIKSGHIGDEARQEMASIECTRGSGRRVTPVHPCSATDVFEPDCSNSRMSEARDEGVALRTRQHGLGSPVGSSRSAVRHIHSAMATAAQSVYPEFPSPEGAGQKHRHKRHPDHE